MMSSRLLMNSTAMSPATTDADFGFASMPQPYPGFDAGNMSMPGLLGHQQHNNNQLRDNFDFAAAGFPFQQADSSSLLPPPPPSMANMTMEMPSLHQMPLVTLPAGVPTAELYHLPSGGGGSSPFLMKREDDGRSVVDHAGGERIGLNLGRRTYFSPADVLAVDHLLTMTRSSRLGGVGLGLGMPGVLGLGLGGAHHLHHHQPPRCQAEGCKADLSAFKHYHRRHKVCEYHAKAATVAAKGKQQRFCQQCSRYVALSPVTWA
jgi:hypothetical protein